MARGPKRGSKRYICHNESCERKGKIQYIQPWAGIRCKGCGSEDLEEVTPTVEVVPEPVPEPEVAEPTVEPSVEPEPPAEEEPEPPTEEEPLNPEPPKPEPRATIVQPRDGDKVRCKKCNWAVFWDSRHHKKIACGAAGCGSTDLEIVMPVEGK